MSNRARLGDLLNQQLNWLLFNVHRPPSTMGHGNSNKLYVTHAEHSGLFGQHTASSSGFKACVNCSNLSLSLSHIVPASQRVLIQLPSHLLTVARCISSHSPILYAPAMQMEREPSSISRTSFPG